MDEEWCDATYRIWYHFNRFTVGWRRLLVFYMAMCIAGYAQAVHAFVFWAAWAALVLMYWEPYLSPPFPWISDIQVEDKFGRSLSLHSTADADEAKSIRQWVFAIQRGLNETQLRVYKVIHSAVLIPTVFLGIGVIKQITLPEYSKERQAVYASSMLLALMVIYSVSVSLCLWAFHRVQAMESAESRAVLVEWKPNDMMFFTCKIIGEVLNTVVQTLVAGAFTAYMPWQIFWLCICITGMSYTATNLLYDFDSNAPVKDGPVGTETTAFLSSSDSVSPVPQQLPDVHCKGLQPGFMKATDRTSSGPEWRGDSAQLARPEVKALPEAAAAADAVIDLSHTDAGRSGGDPAAAAGSTVKTRGPSAAAAAARPQGAKEVQDGRVPAQHKKKPKRPKSPPFLLYKWPKGFRGHSIVGLLIAVAVPSVALLTLLGIGTVQDKPHLYLNDPEGDCSSSGDSCLGRYKQMIIILGLLGCLISYYAFTVGFLGAGPVTWLYRSLQPLRTRHNNAQG